VDTTQTRPNMARRTLITGAAALTAYAALPSVGFTAEARSPIVATTNGKVRGFVQDGISVFKGLRYGADTGGAGRFAAPVKPQPWTDVKDALAYGASSPQGRGEDEAQGEDCLFLNVWTPAKASKKDGLADGGKRPVMFYIHGGAYNTGSGSHPWYEGTKLAKRSDVVVVTINHRLSAFGYLYLARLFNDPTVADSGNAGQLDIVLALQWVRDNIAAFGGDPSRVMPFGQSGGGAKIATLLGMPAAKGLFSSAVTMSGQQVTAGGPFNATKRAKAFLDKTGAKDLAAARALTVAQMVEGLRAVDPIAGQGGVYMGPVLDERSLTRHPFFPDASPVGLSVPLMCGNTHDETKGFIGFDAKAFPKSWEEVIAKLPGQFNARIDIDPETVVAFYRQTYPNYSPSDVYFAASTAGRSWKAAIIQAEERARANAPAYVYQVNWKSPKDGGIFGAPHTIDIGLVFGTLDAKGSIVGTGPESVAMSNTMSDAFVNFARTGNPNGGALPKWEPYTLPRRQTMVFDNTSRMEDDPRGAEREFFNRVPFTQFGT
jgi:para-nitrobenzyl esterase